MAFYDSFVKKYPILYSKSHPLSFCIYKVRDAKMSLLNEINAQYSMNLTMYDLASILRSYRRRLWYKYKKTPNEVQKKTPEVPQPPTTSSQLVEYLNHPGSSTNSVDVMEINSSDVSEDFMNEESCQTLTSTPSAFYDSFIKKYPMLYTKSHPLSFCQKKMQQAKLSLLNEINAQYYNNLTMDDVTLLLRNFRRRNRYQSKKTQSQVQSKTPEVPQTPTTSQLVDYLNHPGSSTNSDDVMEIHASDVSQDFMNEVSCQIETPTEIIKFVITKPPSTPLDVCQICLEPSTKLHSLWDECYKDAETIYWEFCSDLQPSPINRLICSYCLQHLSRAAALKQRCRLATDYLKKIANGDDGVIAPTKSPKFTTETVLTSYRHGKNEEGFITGPLIDDDDCESDLNEENNSDKIMIEKKLLKEVFDKMVNSVREEIEKSVANAKNVLQLNDNIDEVAIDDVKKGSDVVRNMSQNDNNDEVALDKVKIESDVDVVIEENISTVNSDQELYGEFNTGGHNISVQEKYGEIRDFNNIGHNVSSQNIDRSSQNIGRRKKITTVYFGNDSNKLQGIQKFKREEFDKDFLVNNVKQKPNEIQTPLSSFNNILCHKEMDSDFNGSLEDNIVKEEMMLDYDSDST